jgi:hypothetical protein
MKLPRKSIMIGLAKGAKASLAVEMEKTVMKTGMRRAVIGMGIHSVTHHTTTRRKTAKSL